MEFFVFTCGIVDNQAIYFERHVNVRHKIHLHTKKLITNQILQKFRRF